MGKLQKGHSRASLPAYPTSSTRLLVHSQPNCPLPTAHHRTTNNACPLLTSPFIPFHGELRCHISVTLTAYSSSHFSLLLIHHHHHHPSEHNAERTAREHPLIIGLLPSSDPILSPFPPNCAELDAKVLGLVATWRTGEGTNPIFQPSVEAGTS